MWENYCAYYSINVKNMTKEKSPAGIILFLFIGLLLILLSPEDKESGMLLKLVFLHSALITAGLSLFTAGGIVGLISLLRKVSGFTLLFAIEKTAVIFWVAASIIGGIISLLAWGEVFLDAPRLIAAVIVSLLSAGIYFISTASKNPRIISFLVIGLGLSVWTLIMNTGKIIHPDNPFGASGPAIKFYFIIITLAFLMLSIQVVRWMKKQK